MLSRCRSAGYTFLALLTGTILTILMILAGMVLLMAEHNARKYGFTLPFAAGFRLGLTGVFFAWAVPLLVIALGFLDSNPGRACTWVLNVGRVTGFYLLVVLGGSLSSSSFWHRPWPLP